MRIMGFLKKLILFIFVAASADALGEGVVDMNTLLGIFGGIGNIFTNFNTTDVDIERIMGKWHQMYKAAINFDVFQTNMYCHVAYFTPNKVMGPQGFSIEEAYHVIGKSGPIETYKRDVTKTGPGEYWMYTEEYFYPRQFYILKVGSILDDDPISKPIVDDALTLLNNSTDSNDTNSTDAIVRRAPLKKKTEKDPYEYLIATDANRLALMVYARDPVKFYETYDKEILKDLQKGGFGGYVFWNQPVAIYQGSDCFYPTEKEVFARRALKAGGKKESAFAASPLPQQNQAAAGIASLLPQQNQANVGIASLLPQQNQAAPGGATFGGGSGAVGGASGLGGTGNAGSGLQGQSPSALSALLQQQQQILLQQQQSQQPQLQIPQGIPLQSLFG